MMQKVFCTVSILAVLLFMVSVSQATTITSNGTHADNADVPVDFGSNVTADSDDFTISDGTGATPDVILTWAPLPNFWEFHSGAKIAANGFDVPAIQMDMNGGEDPTITFETDGANVALILNSVDMGDATGHSTSAPDTTWDLEITRVSDNQIVKTVSAGPYDETVYIETVNLDFTGDPGEDYILRFVDTDGDPRIYTNMDNLSFSQVTVPEPSTLVLLAMAGLALVGWKRR